MGLVLGWVAHLVGNWVVAVVAGGLLFVGASAVAAVRRQGPWRHNVYRLERLGRSLVERGEYSRMVHEFTQVLAEGTESPAAAYLWRGVGYQHLQDYEHALSDLDEAVALEPRMVAAYLHRGRVRQSRGEHSQALTDDNEALARFPRFARAYYQRALLREEQGALGEALADLDRAVSLPDSPAHAYYRKGVIHEQMGQPEQALAAFRHFLRVASSGDPGRTHACERLRELERGWRAS